VLTYRFGGFTVDCDTRQLLLDDEEVHLSTKAFELLIVLLGNRSRVVSKTELQNRLWPSTFVQETSLAGLVAEIRRALRDNAARPAFVRTVYRVGYRFVGEVREAAAAPRSTHPRVKLCLLLENRQVVLMEGTNVIGRAPDATIQIDSPSVSRYHARILVSDGEATLEDLGSKNGTSVDGERLSSPARLSDGNVIHVGVVGLTFRIAPPMSPTETAPA
jgi:DNA-binding winged helix-turn-helix (wHTH) protein